ncbi:hypothetical protein BGZ61DRAFT_566935 [Ilyonectria robusta]|uniref:uncharacterized protein n=1 Tax=Ilyonectria robusta TaxID=1079257 RepID=UPI001E8D845E|nr:uncharacterized protein BGZ61DRAFT_566935 [Ilyonectria robusta]KAH8659446.1 hypothetical protein BGZ61DRAFT_566935 [Ilyonectria robusta]
MMDITQMIEYDIKHLETASVTFFMNGAQVCRVIPLTFHGLSVVKIHVSGFGTNIDRRSIKVKPRDPTAVIQVNRPPISAHGNHQPLICPDSRKAAKIELQKDDQHSICFTISRGRDDKSDMTETQVYLSYVTSAAFWSPTHELDLYTTDRRATLITKARLSNSSTEKWENCNMSLCSRQVASDIASQQKSVTSMAVDRAKLPDQGIVFEAYRHRLSLLERQNKEKITKKRPLIQNPKWCQNQMTSHCQGACRQQSGTCIYECLDKEIGFETTWHIPGRWSFNDGFNTLPQPIFCTELRDVSIQHIFDAKLDAVYLVAHIRKNSALPFFPGPVWVTLDRSFVGTTTLPDCFPEETFNLTFIDPGIRVTKSPGTGSGPMCNTRMIEVHNTRQLNGTGTLFVPRRIEISHKPAGIANRKQMMASPEGHVLCQAQAWMVNLHAGNKVILRVDSIAP